MTTDVRLRDVDEADIEVFFAQQQDPEAARRANFTPRGHQAFVDHWTHKVLGDPDVRKQTIIVDGRAAGNVVAWTQSDRRFVGYWLGRDHWGRGVGTRAVTLFLRQEEIRPLWADADIGNTASIRLLQRCGFHQVETVKQDDVEFVLLTLTA